MKKISIILIFVIFALSGYGQRRMVVSAWNFLRDGFLKDAKEAIDKAAEHPETKDSYRTFRYKAYIYHELAITEEPQYKDICDHTCLDIAFENYLEAIKRNFVDPKFHTIKFEDELDFMKYLNAIQDQNTRYEDTELLMDIVMNRFPALANAIINRGLDNFQEKLDFEAALNDFEQALLITTLSFKVDTQLIYFASLAAFRSEDFEKAVDYNKTLIEMDFGTTDEEKVSIYQTLVKTYELNEDYEKMLETLEKGIKKFPEQSYPLIIETFNYYVNSNQNEEAYKYISMAIEKNPDDAQFYVIKGALLEDMDRRDDAQQEYLNAVKIDVNNFDANFNLGAYYYNTAVDTIQWADENIKITDFAAHDEISKIANKYFNKALPYLEKSLEIDPDNINVLNTLRIVYYRLENMEEYEKVQERINELTE